MQTKNEETTPTLSAPSDGYLSDKALWRPDWSLELEPSLMSKANRRRMSVSTAQGLTSCQARWAIERIIPSTPDPFGAAELGSAAHQVFEDLYRLPKPLRTPDVLGDIIRDLAVEHADLAAPRDDEEAMARWQDEVRKRSVGIFKMEDPTTVDVIETEMQINDVEIAGVPFVGIIDRIRSHEGHRAIDDYKAGMGRPKKPSRWGDPHGDQIRLYTLAVEAKTGVRPLEGNILYTAHEQWRSIPLTPSAIAKTRKGFVEAHRSLLEAQDRGSFTTTASALCGWCPLVQVCPTALAAGKVARDPIGNVGPGWGIPPAPPRREEPGSGKSRSASATSSAQEETSTSTPRRENTVTTELKPWEETTLDGELNLNSYAAGGAFGLVELAVDTLHEAGIKMTPAAVDALAKTYALVCQRAGANIGGGSLQSGAHTRLRGALRTSIATIPPPFGSDKAAWDAWIGRTTKRVSSIVAEAIALWGSLREGIEGDPYDHFAIAAVKPEAG